MQSSVTSGAIKDMYANRAPSNPIVQVISCSKMSAKSSNDRYRLIISDGMYSMNATLSLQLNDMIVNNQLGVNTLIQLDHYVVNDISNKRIAILLSINIVNNQINQIIGNPVPVDQNNASNTVNTNVPNTAVPMQNNTMSMQNNTMPMQNNSMSMQNNTMPMQNNTMSSNQSFNSSPNSFDANSRLMSIQQLNPYIGTSWSIKGRVMSKGELRHWSNARGEGDLFSVNIMDVNKTEIRGTFFKDQALKYYPVIQPSKVYIFSRGSIKPANKRYSSVNNEYEISFDNSSNVIPVEEDTAISMTHLELKPINVLPQLKANDNVDVLGVIVDCGPVSELHTRSGKDLKRRVLKLKDNSNYVVNLTLFGDKAELPDEQYQVGTVIGVKAAKVSDFNGCSLSCSFNSELLFNPNIPETQQLLNWYATEGQTSPENLVSTDTYTGGDNAADLYDLDKRDYFEDITKKNLGMNEKPDFMTVTGKILRIRQDNLFYPACGNMVDGRVCQKKLIETSVGQWRCDKCNMDRPAPTYRYIVSCQVTDSTQTQWITLFNDQCETIFQMTANEMHQRLEADPTATDSILNPHKYIDYIFKLRVKNEFNAATNKTITRCICHSVTPLDYIKDSNALIQAIDKY